MRIGRLLVRMQLNSRHSAIGRWWDVTSGNARNAYNVYLSLSPLQQSSVRPVMDGFGVTDHVIERYMVSHLVSAMPEHIRKTLLRGISVCSGDVLFQAMVDAGPGTKEDRTRTLQSVGSKGPHVPPHAVYDRLQQWMFDMNRLHSLGVVPPDPSVQIGVLTHYVSKLAEANPEFCYRLKRLLHEQEPPRRGHREHG